MRLNTLRLFVLILGILMVVVAAVALSGCDPLGTTPQPTPIEATLAPEEADQ